MFCNTNFIKFIKRKKLLTKSQLWLYQTVVQHSAMRNKFILLLIIFSLLKIDFGFSQNNTIKGKVVSSISLKKPNGEIYIIEKGTTNGTLADSLGFFTLIPLKEKNNYFLEITVGSYDKLDYEYE